MKGIFICYRRSETQHVAGELFRALRVHFGEALVFRDKESIPGGFSWRHHVLERIARDTVVLVLMGRNWASLTDERGRLRLADPHDPIRMELYDALRDRATIIPILVEDAVIPPKDWFPPELQPIAGLNTMRLRDGDWVNDFGHLCERLKAHFPEVRASVEPLSVGARITRSPRRARFGSTLAFLAGAFVMLCYLISLAWPKGPPAPSPGPGPSGTSLEPGPAPPGTIPATQQTPPPATSFVGRWTAADGRSAVVSQSGVVAHLWMQDPGGLLEGNGVVRGNDVTVRLMSGAIYAGEVQLRLSPDGQTLDANFTRLDTTTWQLQYVRAAQAAP